MQEAAIKIILMTYILLIRGLIKLVLEIQFKIPPRSYDNKVGATKILTIRFIRTFTNFEKPVVTRFASFELVRGSGED